MEVRGETTSQQEVDMADRLVFVSLKGGPTLPSGRPLRKAVVPLPENTQWESFLSKVALKLKIPSVSNVYLASSLKPVMSMADLEDIDELLVEAGKSPQTQPSTSYSPAAVQGSAPDNQRPGSHLCDAHAHYIFHQIAIVS